MSSSVDITINITIPRVEGLSKSQVEERARDRGLYLGEIRQKLLMLASSNPRDIIPIEWNEEPLRWLQDQVLELIGEYDDTTREEIGLLHYLEVYDQYNTKDNE